MGNIFKVSKADDTPNSQGFFRKIILAVICRIDMTRQTRGRENIRFL